MLQLMHPDYGIGPWAFQQLDAGNAQDFHEYGLPVERLWRGAATMVGRVHWELIQPLDEESVFARFLAEKGEGVHHIAVVARNFDETVANHAKGGNDLVLRGKFSGVDVAYLDTDRDLGVIIEIFSGIPDDNPASP